MPSKYCFVYTHYKLSVLSLVVFITLSFCVFSIALPTFTDVTGEVGVGDEGKGFSVAFIDYNGDGHLDMYISNGNASATLYQNDGDGTFTNVIKETGLENLKIGQGTWEGASGVWGDYDNDGDLDLYAVIDCWSIDPDAVLPCFNVLYGNNGDGTFTDVTEGAGVQGDPGAGTAAIWGDYDNDNYLDLYVVNLGAANILYKNNGDGTFMDVTALVGGVEGGEDAASSGVSAVFLDYDNDNDLDLYAVNGFGPPSFLYQNNGDGTFKDVSQKAKVDDPGDPSCATVGDYDNDGYLDIYVVNFFKPNALYRNQGDGKFEDVAKKAGIDFEGMGMSASFVDYDNDGYLDIYVVNKGPNLLYRNNGDGTFSDVAKGAGVISEQGGTTCAFGDYDKDGDLDLYVANSGPPGSPKGEPNQLYRNNGSENNWLHVDVRSKYGHVDAIGARVEVIAGNLRQIAEVSGGLGILQNSLPLEFGLGKASSVDSVKVYWPDGTIWIVENEQVNQTLTIFDDTGIAAVEPSHKFLSSLGQIKVSVLYQNYPNPFNPETWIPYQLASDTNVSISIYDIHGKLVRLLRLGQQPGGMYQTQDKAAYWDGKDSSGQQVASGVYLYTLRAGEFKITRKMVILK